MQNTIVQNCITKYEKLASNDDTLQDDLLEILILLADRPNDFNPTTENDIYQWVYNELWSFACNDNKLAVATLDL